MSDTFLTKLDKIINAKFIKAAPLRVDFLVHDLETKSESNIEAASTLAKEKHEVLYSFPNGDQLNFYNGGIVLLTKALHSLLNFIVLGERLYLKEVLQFKLNKYGVMLHSVNYVLMHCQ